MNLLSFTANFGSEEVCRLHFKEERDKIGVVCNAEAESIFGYKADGVTNAKHVEAGLHCEVAL
jgi:hypothetical protein